MWKLVEVIESGDVFKSVFHTEGELFDVLWICEWDFESRERVVLKRGEWAKWNEFGFLKNDVFDYLKEA